MNPSKHFLGVQAEADYSQAEVRRQQEEAKRMRLQGQNPDGNQDGDFMSEAKDWAGELISGQTGTGRILVSTHCRKIHWKS